LENNGKPGDQESGGCAYAASACASERRACGLIDQPRSTQLYTAKPKPGDGLQKRITEPAAARFARSKRVPNEIAGPNQPWGMAFVSDRLAAGRSFRALAIVDPYSRECPVSDVDLSLPGTRVLRPLEQLAEERGLPAGIRADHGPEFVCDAVRRWCERKKVQLDYIDWDVMRVNGELPILGGQIRFTVMSKILLELRMNMRYLAIMRSETDDKHTRFRQFMVSSKWYAACEDGHSFWSGDLRNSQPAAQTDATAHDQERHSGIATAVVLPLD
jgi:integrase-like protein